MNPTWYVLADSKNMGIRLKNWGRLLGYYSLSTNYPCKGFSKRDKQYIDTYSCIYLYIMLLRNLRKGFSDDIKVTGQLTKVCHKNKVLLGESIIS